MIEFPARDRDAVMAAACSVCPSDSHEVWFVKDADGVVTSEIYRCMVCGIVETRSGQQRGPT